jgi:hypothetical protein
MNASGSKVDRPCKYSYPSTNFRVRCCSTQANSLEALVEHRPPSYLKFLRHLLSVSMNIKNSFRQVWKFIH